MLIIKFLHQADTQVLGEVEPFAGLGPQILPRSRTKSSGIFLQNKGQLNSQLMSQNAGNEILEN